MDPIIIGREEEIRILDRLLKSKEPELLAVYGRRRVGKTYLIRSYYKNDIAFQCSGQSNAKTSIQLGNFAEQLRSYFRNVPMVIPHTWQEAFQLLRSCLDQTEPGQKKVLFFDELPWLDTHKSGFLSAFSYFWNVYVSQRSDLLVVICGSAASWIIDKVVNNKGGLHNRITQRIRLMPFTLKETEAYLKHQHVKLDRYSILQLYMVMGGVPAYLKAVERGTSIEQTIEKCCFTKDGALSEEFSNLYSALFDHPEKHVMVIRALAKKNKGLTRSELLKAGDLPTGGGITTVLSELTESGFIQKTLPHGKKEKDSLYRLTDEFSLFYLRFMQRSDAHRVEHGTWSGILATPGYITWCGYAFENICLKHVAQIKVALGIGAVKSAESSWYRPGGKKEDGAQIDLLIDRADRSINICEMKFSTKPFAIDKKYATELERKMRVFRQQGLPEKDLFLTFITTFGVTDNEYKETLVEAEVKMDGLFE